MPVSFKLSLSTIMSCYYYCSYYELWPFLNIEHSSKVKLSMCLELLLFNVWDRIWLYPLIFMNWVCFLSQKQERVQIGHHKETLFLSCHCDFVFIHHGRTLITGSLCWFHDHVCTGLSSAYLGKILSSYSHIAQPWINAKFPTFMND
jgi:hypothetical protein